MRRATGGAAGIILGVGLGLAPSCQTTGFTCESDQACAGLADAQCEPSGHCSVPDSECDSGRRYAPESGELSDECVAGASGEGESSTSPSPSTSSTTMGTTLPLDDSSSGSPLETGAETGAETGMETGMEESSTGEIPPEVSCPGAVIIDERFDAETIDTNVWELYEEPGIELAVLAGELHIDLHTNTNLSAYAGLRSIIPLPPIAIAGAELTTVPDDGLPAETYVVLFDPNLAYGFYVSGGYIRSFVDDDGMFIIRNSSPYDATEQRWLGLSYDGGQGTMQWLISTDAIRWQIVDEELDVPLGFDFEGAQLEVGGGAWEGPYDATPLAAFGRAFVCAT